jgi:hypothetical protein
MTEGNHSVKQKIKHILQKRGSDIFQNSLYKIKYPDIKNAKCSPKTMLPAIFLLNKLYVIGG